jgi:hypothetical protein
MRDFRGFPHSLQANTEKVPQPGSNRFISNPFQSPITLSLEGTQTRRVKKVG